MDIVVYDGTWGGLLTAIFEVYEYKLHEPEIFRTEGAAPAAMFGKMHLVNTNAQKAERVRTKLLQKLTPKSFQRMYKTSLSEITGIENVILRYVQYVLASKATVEYNFSHPDVLLIQQTSKKVDREKHRMDAFIRFELTKDSLYYAIVQPDYNVLPLIISHFKNRYADQRWLIYDVSRKYGIYYDLQRVTEVLMDFSEDVKPGSGNKDFWDEDEALYRTLWQQYFKSVNIKARKNTKLHIQHMPRRYWKYLTEKQ